MSQHRNIRTVRQSINDAFSVAGSAESMQFCITCRLSIVLDQLAAYTQVADQGKQAVFTDVTASETVKGSVGCYLHVLYQW